MSSLKTLAPTSLALVAAGIALACSPTVNQASCPDFRPGADLSQAAFGENTAIEPQLVAFGEAAGDVDVAAGEALVNVTEACRRIAVDLGADPGGVGIFDASAASDAGVDAGAEGLGGQALMNFWCEAATVELGAALAALGEPLVATSSGGGCSSSLVALASCEESCATSTPCDLAATPPQCLGGVLDYDCTGTCGAPDGGAPDAAIDCIGTCSGICDGTCDGTIANATACAGTCAGTCDGTCSPGDAATRVECSGACSADGGGALLLCRDGVLSGGCKVDSSDPACDSNCAASVDARAACVAPTVTVTSPPSALGVLGTTLTANAPALLLVARKRGLPFLKEITPVVNGGASLTMSGQLDSNGTACVTVMTADLSQAVADYGAAITAAGSVLSTVGL